MINTPQTGNYAIIPPVTQSVIVPPVTLLITTYELAEMGWRATVTHIFFGETEDEARRIAEAHRKTDAFFDGSFRGEWNGIILKNSQEVIQRRR